jgi:hypothetical protein
LYVEAKNSPPDYTLTTREYEYLEVLVGKVQEYLFIKYN